MKLDFKKLIKCIAIPLVVGGVSSFITMNAMETFKALRQPPLSPPDWLFPVAWTILYTLMGVSSYLTLSSKDDREEVISTKVIYYAQLIVNFLWPIFFFNLGWYLFSFFWLLFLWVLVIVMIKRFAGVSKVAAAMNIPYLLWLTFAAYLNLGVWWLNR